MTELSPKLIEGLMRNVPPLPDLEGRIEVRASDPGSVRYTIDVPESLSNYRGTVHGGTISLLLEIAAGMATYAHGVGNVALANATNFIRAVGVQRLNVSASTSHKGRSTAVVHCSIETEEGKLVAEATYTMFLFGPLDQQG
ncbi:PaaI family thioesterase [Rubneribacter badeniensis]|uniref:PaaI family thioesterase n=1 Tax=Rubneribacter badeniensis TaxID=2070688 RepID=A0A2K2U813_9ACTN|nr:PaaI family thioesterase [Rubneribacter badeniensis]PNV66473.1 PaaI family thioesterase [Rubneribacter badeniensis]CVH76268.1 Thioesterase superfamily protein [Coriobacteriaceae bacterium CHKCI002]